MKLQDKMQDKTKYAASLRKFFAEKFGSLGEWLKEYLGTLWQIFALPQLAKEAWQKLKLWRPMQVPRRKLAFAAALLLMLCAAFALQLYGNSIVGKLESQQAAERWRGTNAQAFAQTSLFLPESRAWTESDVRSTQQQLEKNLEDAGVTAAEGTSLWIDAYASGVSKVRISAVYGETDTECITVGGDWFFFHPLQLRSGSYISGNDLMKDRIVINEQLAWRLFGAIDVAGMVATINGNNYYVAGVVKTETDKATQKVRSDSPMLFLLQGAADGDENITAYELVSPEPFKNYAYYFLAGLAENGGEAVNNSRRFAATRTFTQMLHPAERAVQDSGAALPYWENAARVAEVWQIVLLMWKMVLLALPVSTAVLYLWRGFRCARRYCKLKWQEFSLTR